MVYIEENYIKTVTVDGKPSIISIIDTAGQQNYKALRDQQLKDGQGFVLVFALNDIRTFEEAKQLRKQIFKVKQTKKIPIVFCGNKCVSITSRLVSFELILIEKDLPESDYQVKDSDVEPLMKEGVRYLETSAKENINVQDSFALIIKECRSLGIDGSKSDKKTSFFKKLFTKKSKLGIQN